MYEDGGYTVRMPPQQPHSPIPNPNEDRLLPRPSGALREGGLPPRSAPVREAAPASEPVKMRSGQKSTIGPFVGIIIILVLLVLGAFYFWGAHLNTVREQEQNLPLIPGDSTTTVVEIVSTTSTSTSQ